MIEVVDKDNIAAIATPPGMGGVSILRISGRDISVFKSYLVSTKLEPRYATYTSFLDDKKNAIDKGIAIYFPAPNSFTGEEVLELHGHGGPAVMDLLLKRSLQLGARLARAGEFSERAFLNDKIDLIQAEAISDLIHASSEQAARCAIRSLQGEFSKKISVLLDKLTSLRMHVEAAIDFPEEEIDFLSDPKILNDLESILLLLRDVKAKAHQGSLISEGISIVIAGKPNAGKSSLLNALSGRDSAIVSNIAGTTRDVLREHIHLDGMPVHIIDTAGLHETKSSVEQEGIRRAWSEIDQADCILYIIDSSSQYSLKIEENWPEYFNRHPNRNNIIYVLNKSDITSLAPGIKTDKHTIVTLSAKNHDGMGALTDHLKTRMGYTLNEEGAFVARRRHVEALNNTERFLLSGKTQLMEAIAGDLLAEDLRLAQQSLSSITGAFNSDDLLGEIFGSFCVGK
ncbi:MAG: tRNA uridine-5-carboxymethylaminomethyl(34) synthesis GTPase MnmE [Porticoccus sp.]|jgi:tRNA modification GTPase|nr:tRNA uridine-5-carboxymethylaminomethyl(34) synthesis GTPase MnmE [Porticoccus sp.]